jgi:holo-[acyl-carrier protein] synthase
VAILAGIDLVAIDEVEESLLAQGERYLNHVYTKVEQRECRSDPRRLAARFAAKEATAKVLAVSADEALPWPSIEVTQDAGAPPAIRLTGEAAALAERRGIHSLSLSLTVRSSSAMAVVVAEVIE